MVKFLICIDTLANFEKKTIDKGETPLDVYRVCSCIREAFCLSYAIRKENEFYIFINQNNLLLKLMGKSLRYLGSDERSQALLLLKALKIKQSLSHSKWINSTPGIFIKKVIDLEHLISFIKQMGARIFLIDEINPTLNITTDYTINHQDIVIFDELKEKSLNLHQIGHIERFIFPSHYSLENKILYINYQLDQQQPPKL